MIYKILGVLLIIGGIVAVLLGILAGIGGADIFSLLRIILLGSSLLIWGLRLVLRKRD